MPKLIHQLTEGQIQQLVLLYQQEWWCKARVLPDVKQMLGNCSMLFALVEGEELVGFTRVLSDFVYKALILDVIIARPYRGKGWGQSLMQQVIDHPRLQSTHHLELYCLPEMEPFYKTFGFQTQAKEANLLFMRLTRA